MNFHYSATTTHRPHTTSSHFNEDARCDNEVNLILEKNHSKQLLEKATFSEQQKLQQQQQQQQQQKQQQPQQPPPPPPPPPTSSSQPQPSVAVNQTEQYYFMPIREQSSTMALHTNNNNSIAADDTSIVSIDHEKPSKHDIFDCSKTTASHTSSFASAGTNKGNNQYLNDTDLADLFASSMVSISRASTTADKNDITDNPNTLDDIFFQQVSELVCSSHHNALGPPPGFENFRFDTSSSSSASASLTTVSSISTAAAVQSKVTSSDITNFSQLLPSTNVDSQPPVLMAANACSSSSSHSSFTSDDQTIFFPMGAHPYSSSSQIFPLNTHHSTTTNSMNSNAKPFLPNSLSTNAKHFASLDKSGAISPKLATHADTDTLHKDGNETPSQVFPSPHSFFTNGHADFVPAKPASNKTSSTSTSTNRQSSSSASSSTSSSIDEALIQLTQQQQSQAQASTVNKFFSDDTLSIFNIPSSKPPVRIDKQQLAMHDNINLLASMAAASTPATPESPWQQSTAHASTSAPAKRQSTRASHQSIIPQSPSKSGSTNMQELMDSLNELCYRGFDELNALIQEQRWVQNYLNVNPSAFPTSSGSPLTNLNGTNCCSSRILIVPEYFIFKCKKVEVTASHVYDLLATGRPELRLRDLMFVFKSWRETIANAEHVHQEEEMKLRLNTEHFPSYYMNETILQAVFERVYLVTRQLVSMTQQARAAFQYATLNVFQVSSRQASQTSSNVSQSSNSMGVTQVQGMSQAKSSSVHRLGSSMRTTP